MERLPGRFVSGSAMASRRQLIEEGLQVFGKDDCPGANLARRQLALTDQLKNLGAADAGRLAHVMDREADFVAHGVRLHPDTAGSAAHRWDALGDR